MHKYLIEILVCPLCHGELDWTLSEQDENRIERGRAHCAACGATYHLRQGIGLFLTPDLPRDDLWEQVDSKLIQYLGQHAEVERRLMDVPLDTLAPADLFFRALVLEERRDYEAAKAVEALAMEGIYTPAYRACSQSQFDYVLEQLSEVEGPIVDLASGRGYLVERLAGSLGQPIVATDFSPRVLRNNRRRWEHFGLYDRVSLLAFDARRTPFRDGGVKTLTTNLGLPNIEQPDKLLPELRRFVTGNFLTISHFYPEDDQVNAAALGEAGLSKLLYRSSAIPLFSSAGWEVKIANLCAGEARPTPKSVILEGAGIDAFPVRETTLDWCVLVAN
jgi:uncharacterized protein YbaR (Trm112 family)